MIPLILACDMLHAKTDCLESARLLRTVFSAEIDSIVMNQNQKIVIWNQPRLYFKEIFLKSCESARNGITKKTMGSG